MPSHFKFLPKVEYDIDNDGKTKKEMTNIFTVMRVAESFANNPLAYYEYQVKDSETPEMIASLYYGSPTYSWVVLMLNNIINVEDEWPRNSNVTDKVILGEYGSRLAADQDILYYVRKNTTEDYYVVVECESPTIKKGVLYNADTWRSKIFPLIKFNDVWTEFKVTSPDYKISKTTYENLEGTDKNQYEVFTGLDKIQQANTGSRIIKLLAKDKLKEFLDEVERVAKL
tara:strand:+ start:2049 stop:2732 length:684 start_codon:yes stop_codon:yes gene_type:complete